MLQNSLEPEQMSTEQNTSFYLGKLGSWGFIQTLQTTCLKCYCSYPKVFLRLSLQLTFVTLASRLLTNSVARQHPCAYYSWVVKNKNQKISIAMRHAWPLNVHRHLFSITVRALSSWSNLIPLPFNTAACKAVKATEGPPDKCWNANLWNIAQSSGMVS